MAAFRLACWLLVVLGLVLGCGREPSRPGRARAASPAAAASLRAEPPEVLGNAARGQELVARYECNRCHDGTGLGAAPVERHCTQCHDQIARRTFKAPAEALARWHGPVEPFRDAPSLEALGRRLKPAWIARFLERPYDVRPHLAASMPRLALSSQQSHDIAAYLTPRRAVASVLAADGDPARGRQLMEQRACGSCHEFSGVPALPHRPDPRAGSDDTRRAVGLAPDLRHTRDRFEAQALIDWLVDPQGIQPGTRMPSFAFSLAEARDVASYLLSAELAVAPPPVVPARLPLLARKVGYEEVEQQVFRRTCRHCHGDPDTALGDGGPGNTGGFGFEPRGLNLSSYAGIASGLVRAGERRSAFSPTADGTPLLVATLLVRQSEQSGGADPAVRGMPLGLPALTPEQIQLVESWVAQGRPR